MNVELSDVKSIFLRAIETYPPDQWPAFLDGACAGDPDLRTEVERLLALHVNLGTFHEQARPVGVATILAHEVAERPGAEIGPYKLLEQIGEGGMGVVYMAEQREPVRRTVALKVIKPGMDTRQVVARFEAERQALALMNHPHIAKFLDAGTTEGSRHTPCAAADGSRSEPAAFGRPYFVMELVKGTPITEFCDAQRLSTRERLRLFILVCQAVGHAHQKGLIHRDLKPSNLLVEMHDVTAVPKVIDFGVAKAMGQQLTEKSLHTGFMQMVGTPLYMSPEQAGQSSIDVDTRSDIYSLGVLLYELLTGTTPFDKETLTRVGHDELRRMIREDDPPRPSARVGTLEVQALSTVSDCRKIEPRKLSQQLRGELDWIVMKALEKDRARRYESASALAADVQRYLNDEPVQACPPSATYRFRKFTRRNKHASAAAGVLGLAVIIAIGAVSGSAGWVLSDRAARCKETDRAVNAALNESRRLQDRLKPNEALLQVQQASAILATGAGTPALHQRVRERLDDLTFVLQLEEIRSGWGSLAGSYAREAFDQTDQRFAKAFRQFGVDFDSLSADEAARRLGQRTVAVEVAAALDTRVFLAKRLKVDKPRWQKLLVVARAIDPEPTRSRMREIVEREDTEALADLLKTIKVEELSAQTALFFAHALEDADRRDDALKVLLRAQLRHPDDYWLCGYLSLAQVGRPSNGDNLRFAALAAALHPQDATNHYILGATLLDLGRSAEGIAACQEAIRLKPDDAMAHDMLGRGLQSQGNLERAIAAYREAIRLAPDHALAHDDLAKLFAAQGKFDEAIACWREILRLNPSPYAAAAHTHVGDALAKQGKWSDALTSFREAVRLKPNYAQAQNDMAWLLATCPDRSVQDAALAVECAQKAVALAPQVGESQNTLGVAHYRAGNWPDALAALENSMAMTEGGSAIDWYFLAMANWQLDHKAEACQWYDRAVEWTEKNQPHNEELLRFRAEAAELLGVKDESKPEKTPLPKPGGD